VIGEADLVPTWPAHGWLLVLALSSQVLGWLLITVSLPRLPAALTSVTLTIQPVGSVFLGVILLGESPSLLQLAGGVVGRPLDGRLRRHDRDDSDERHSHQTKCVSHSSSS